MRASRQWQLAIAALGAAALLAACSSSATGSAAGPSAKLPDTPTTAASVSCARITALRTDVSHITVNVKTGTQVSADLTAIETALVALKSLAQTVYRAEARQIGADLTVIGREAEMLSLRPTAANVKHTKMALNDLKKLVNSVTTGIQRACPSS
jgi:SepF-like predicted cell division protein (DUF552 family)